MDIQTISTTSDHDCQTANADILLCIESTITLMRVCVLFIQVNQRNQIMSRIIAGAVNPVPY